MKNLALALLVAALLDGTLFAAPSKLYCTAAKKEVKTCCCEMKNGKSICKLTGKTFGKCCCITK